MKTKLKGKKRRNQERKEEEISGKLKRRKKKQGRIYLLTFGLEKKIGQNIAF
jgi:hypothetical protein